MYLCKKLIHHWLLVINHWSFVIIMKRSTIYLFIALHIEVVLIFAGLTILIFTFLKGGQGDIPIMTNILPASLISFFLGYLAGEYLPWEKLPPWARFWLGLGVFYAIFAISSLLGFYMMGLIYGNLSDDYWRLFYVFFLFTSILILLIGGVLGTGLSRLKKF